MKTMTRTEKEFIKEIESGKYSECYLIYNRKSTDEAENQKNSIQYQKAENSKFAINNGLPIAVVSLKGFCTNGVISEKHSGFKEDDNVSFTSDGMVQYKIDRPKFKQLLAFFNKGYFKGLVALSWDRISRNKGDDTILRKLMRRGIDVHFAYASYDKTSAGALHMDIDSMFSQHHSRVTSEKVTIATRNKREQGVCTYKAPFGYLNLGDMHHKPFDEERAPFVVEAFELYATGEWTLSDIARHGDKKGIGTVPMRRQRTSGEALDEDFAIENIPKTSRPLTENHISRILNNPFYLGKIIDGKGGYITSISHEPLIDEELFNKVQKQLKSNKVSTHYTEKLEMLLRGMMRCNTCRRVYTPYIKKGIQYYSSRCRKDCTNTFKSFNFDFVSSKIGEKIKELHFTDAEFEEMDARTGTEIAILEEKRHKEMSDMDKRKKKLRADLAYLRSNKLSLLRSGTYSPDEYSSEELKLNDELEQLKDSEDVSDQAMRAVMEDVKKLSELIRNVGLYYDFAKPHEKEQIICTIFSELLITDKTLTYTAKEGLECLFDHSQAVCSP